MGRNEEEYFQCINASLTALLEDNVSFNLEELSSDYFQKLLIFDDGMKILAPACFFIAFVFVLPGMAGTTVPVLRPVGRRTCALWCWML